MDRLSAYDYVLPEQLIAQTPLDDRAASRLLYLSKTGAIEHLSFRDAPSLLRRGDLLVMNDTRVSAVRLLGRRPTGGAVEALLVREVAEGKYEALVKPGKRLKPGSEIEFAGELSAVVVENLEEGMKLLDFGIAADLKQRLAAIGLVPLPPYIHKVLADKERYQTVYGVQQGSAAAPTAGLHFTREILEDLQGQGVEIATVTLHVGIDTFRPVQVENLDDHRMHGERCEISEQAAAQINLTTGRIIAVGTTSVRTLESFAVGKKQVASGVKESRLFIRPGFDFQIVDGMFTNFHLPRTTMLVMISAMVGRETLLCAYDQAVSNGYRFLSFGDSMLVL